jgi:peptidoglycan lytic transglycosylase
MKNTIANILLLSALALCNPLFAMDQDAAFMAAREAFQKGNIERLSQLAPQLQDYPLSGYINYWQLRLRLNESSAPIVEAFMADHRDSLLNERVRGDWLRVLARNQDWDAFEKGYAGLAAEDTELTCYALQARLFAHQDATAYKDARPLWFQGTPQPDSCVPVFDAMVRHGVLSEDDVWSRIRLALEANNVSLIRQIVLYLPAGKRPDPRIFETVARNPQRYLDHSAAKLKSRGEREAAMFAILRLGQSLPLAAAGRLEKMQSQLYGEEQSYVWAQLAVAGAMKHRVEALGWFARGGDRLNDRQRNWQARLALRQQDWATVLSAIEAMSPKESQFPVWRYWRARALLAVGRTAEAYALLTALSFQHSFYGQLALEEIGTSVGIMPDSYRPSPEEIAAMERVPGIQRALKFYQLGLRYEGALEWRWTTRGLNDKELIAAAEVARVHGWYERSIDTAERTQTVHDFELRFPTPYREVVRGYSQQLVLDEAWVYGLVRQESRFSADARSSAGAVGLMQLMPTTARAVARRFGLPGFDRTSFHVVETNIGLGTYHLRQLLDSLDNQPVLASAAYNAGLTRARDWRPERTLEGAAYAETIPFSETRDYVRKVMSNTMYYARLFGQPFISLKQRLGQVASKAGINE